jgi:hypothetical protein
MFLRYVLPTSLYSAVSQKNKIVILTAVKTKNLTVHTVLYGYEPWVVTVKERIEV